MPNIFDQLKAPFPPDRISWRVGSTNREKTKGMALAYIDSRDVQERLDAACGPGGWQDRFPHAATKTICEIGIKIDDEWIWRADGSGDSDIEAEKGAISGAFKRAAVKWGIGRYLYDIPATWVEIEPAGKSFKIKESEYAKLSNVLRRNAPASIPAKSAPVDVSQISPDALTLMAQIDHHDESKKLVEYGGTIASAVAKLAQAEQDKVRGHFASRLKALKAAEALAA